MAIAAMASRSSGVRIEPHGLCGLLMTMSRVRSVTRPRSSSMSIRKSCSCRSGMGTGVAPVNRAIDS